MKKKIFAVGLTLFISLGVSNNILANEYVFQDKTVTSESQTVVEIRDTRDLDILKMELEKFIKKNPNSTESDQNNHLISFIKSGGLVKLETRGLGDYVPGYNNLNSAERKLALRNPVQALTVYDNANIATNKTKEVYNKNGFQDNSDAFRHCLWNALMKQSIGETAAEEWATAHEYHSSGLDRLMDLHNNDVGRKIYVSGQSISAIVNSVKSRVRNGDCRRIVNSGLVRTDGSGMR